MIGIKKKILSWIVDSVWRHSLKGVRARAFTGSMNMTPLSKHSLSNSLSYGAEAAASRSSNSRDWCSLWSYCVSDTLMGQAEKSISCGGEGTHMSRQFKSENPCIM